MQLSSTSALITGASRGLGQALAEQLAARGARVALVARDRVALEAVAAGIRARGGLAHAIVADLGDKDATHAIAGAAAALVGPVQLLIHGAATLGTPGLRAVLDTECEDLERALLIDAIGPHRLTRAVVGPMTVRGEGLVIHVSSDAALEGYAGWGAYAAAKAALEALGRTLAGEIEGTGVRSWIVDPGEMDTLLHAEALPGADRAALASPGRVAARLVAQIAASEGPPNGARLVIDSLPEAA